MTDALDSDPARQLRVRLPPTPVRVQRATFPLAASLAPIGVAALLWAFTRSPFALLFALTGPLIALAGVADAARTTRAARRRARIGFAAAVGVAEERIALAHAEERRRAWARTPSATDAFLAGIDDPLRWSRRIPDLVVLGSGSRPSAVRLDDIDVTEDGDEAGDRARLRILAARTDDMPVTCGVLDGVGLVGEEAVTRSMLRGILLQLCTLVAPDAVAICIRPESGWSWIGDLPAGGDSDDGFVIDVVSDATRAPAGTASATRIRLASARTLAGLPPGCGTIVVVRSAVDAEVVRGAPPDGSRFVPELISEEQAAAHARLLARLWPGTASSRLPDRVGLTQLIPVMPPTGSLACAIGADADGPVVVDLVVDGPHAVIGGTTGSGKSELLVTWLTAMASALPPQRLAFLVIDFKGGATGAVIARLPHCLGVVSDLDGELSDRVAASLRAELIRRERFLADAGVRQFDELDPDAGPPRLVIVVDELAALLARTPELNGLFADIAARGRSLGLHLILCTQRPAGVVRDALFANCSLRISLRVNDASDSVAVVGTRDAVAFPRENPGRCAVAAHGRVRLLQAAETTADDIDRVRGAAAGLTVPERPWLEPLPARLDPGHPFLTATLAAQTAPSPGVLFGLVDDPQRQRRALATWHPAHGGLLVAGGGRSGVSTLLESVAAALGADVVSADVETAWDAITGDGSMPLVLDDWDAVSGLWEPEHRQAATTLLERRLRRGDVVAIGTHRASLGPLAAAVTQRLVLRLDDRADHALLGADPALWNPRLPAGGGVWDGLRMQAVLPGPGLTRASRRPKPPLLAARGLIVVATAPSRTADLIRHSDPAASVVELTGAARGSLDVQQTAASSVLVGDAEAFSMQPQAFATLRSRIPVVFDGCSLAEIRMLLHSRDLPPALDPGSRRVWVFHPDGRVQRARPGW
ncbi:MAG: FtsK/SpoIIIE domain-containing protein [Leifsonia sp.]